MAAYAALVSVMQIIDQLERHPSPPISLDKQQVESLTEIVIFLQEFLEGYNSPFAYSDEADPLEMRIADAVYVAEDVIESCTVNAIELRCRSTNTHRPRRSYNEEVYLDDFYQDLQKVIEEMDSIKKVVVDMKREDDIWGIDVWEKMKFIFADCNNGSRILIITTRQSYLTSQLTDSYALDMKFLDAANSWNLFIKIVFGKEEFPPYLEEIGKKIVKHCRGLPLSIVVLGGLLAKSQHTQEHWEHVEQKLSSIVNSENDEHCLKILKLSYNHLSAYSPP